MIFLAFLYFAGMLILAADMLSDYLGENRAALETFMRSEDLTGLDLFLCVCACLAFWPIVLLVIFLENRSRS